MLVSTEGREQGRSHAAGSCLQLTARGGVGGGQLDVGARPEPAEDVKWLQILARLAAREVAESARCPDVDDVTCGRTETGVTVRGHGPRYGVTVRGHGTGSRCQQEVNKRSTEGQQRVNERSAEVSSRYADEHGESAGSWR